MLNILKLKTAIEMLNLHLHKITKLQECIIMIYIDMDEQSHDSDDESSEYESTKYSEYSEYGEEDLQLDHMRKGELVEEVEGDLDYIEVLHSEIEQQLNNELESINEVLEDIDEKFETIEETMMETPEKLLWCSSRTKKQNTFLDPSNSGQSYDEVPAKVFMTIMNKCLQQCCYNKVKKKYLRQSY